MSFVHIVDFNGGQRFVQNAASKGYMNPAEE